MSGPYSSPSTPPSLSANALSYLTLLLNIIENRDWPTFNEVAVQNPTAFQALSQIISTAEEFNGMSFLHAIVRNEPPLTVVAQVIAICPDSPKTRDCLNRTPLHVAAGVGASAQVIKYLALSYPAACKIRDEDGRTPLHFACDVDCRLFENDDAPERRRSPPSFEVVHALLSACFSVAAMEDDDEMSPLEYAIFSDADGRVVKLLQKAAQKHMKKMHAEKRKENEACGEQRTTRLLQQR